MAWLCKRESSQGNSLWDNLTWQTIVMKRSFAIFGEKGHGITVWKTNQFQQNDVHTFIAHKIFEKVK